MLIFFDHKFIILISIQGIAISKHMYFLTRNPMGISPRRGKAQKVVFGYASTPDGLPDPENLYLGVLRHAEPDFDCRVAPN